MKKIISGFTALTFLALSFIFALPAQTNAATSWNVTGHYNISFDYMGSPYVHDMDLVQSTSDLLTGSGGNPVGAHVYNWVLTSGSVVGNAIDFYANYTSTPDAVTPLTVMHVMGTIANNGTMSGTWTDNYQGGARGGTWVTVLGAATQTTTTSTLVVTPANNQGWIFNPDPNNTTPYEFTTDKHSIGLGSLYVQPIGSDVLHKFIAVKSLAMPVADLNSISYDFQIAGDGRTTTDSNQFYLNVYTNKPGSTTYYDCRFDYVSTAGSTTNFTTSTFNATDIPVNVGGASCPTTLAGMAAGSTIKAIALNMGDTTGSDIGLAGYFDKVVVNSDFNITTYDFDPTPVVPTAKDQCKNGGWGNFTGKTFKNQGQCVSYVQANEHAGK